MKFDRYFYVARAMPAVYSSLPALVTYYFFIKWISPYFFNEISQLKFFGSLAIASLLVFLVGMLARFIGKEWFEDRLYQSRTDLPTTRMLFATDNKLSAEYKEKIYKKIAHDFDIEINGKRSEAKQITEAIALVRNSLRSNTMVLQYNTQYGLVRNIVGGSVIGVFFSIINLILAYEYSYTTAFQITIIFGILSLAPLLASRILITKHAEDYATALFEAYLS